jgi:hypothetical protein
LGEILLYRAAGFSNGFEILRGSPIFPDEIQLSLFGTLWGKINITLAKDQSFLSPELYAVYNNGFREAAAPLKLLRPPGAPNSRKSGRGISA